MTLLFNFSKYIQIYIKSTFECGGRKFNSGSNTKYVNLLLFTLLFIYFLHFVFILENIYNMLILFKLNSFSFGYIACNIHNARTMHV